MVVKAERAGGGRGEEASGDVGRWGEAKKQVVMEVEKIGGGGSGRRRSWCCWKEIRKLRFGPTSTMGFDIECIVDIHTYPGEYFCPVCRTLVYPNEAFQSQCTHLYCKPCLAHIANGTRACPYDGYLVTESDSKPLTESDKALADNIGKVKVHCLYFRSGCAWEGSLSDCTSHCSECSFGNSPVICNRCGIQIVHRQVHDHALTCPGVYEGQQAVTKSGTTSSTATADANQTVAQSGAALSQTVHNLQNVSATPLPGQNPTVQSNAISQAPVVASIATATPEQWYQQQYQQYYQQYPGYDPYQQPSQQYYPPLQQQPFQQYQQHPLPVQGQNQSHAPQPQPQPNPVSQTPQQPHVQPQAQGQAQPQLQPQMQLLPQAQPQLQVPPQGQAAVHAPTQATVPSFQVNPQQQPHPPMRPQAQIPSQGLPPPPPPPSQPMQLPPFAQAIGMRPPAQHPQGPQYQQPHVQMHHPQASQAHVQTQMHPQPQPQSQPQSSNQTHVQIQPQAQPYHTQSQPPVFSHQANQSVAPASMPQAMHPPVPPVSGHHSYQQPQPAQNIQSGASQQHPMHPHPASGSLHQAPIYGQVPQQPTMMRPPHSHGSLPQQQPPTLLPPQNQVPGMYPAQHQQFPPQPTHRPVMHPVQQAVPQQYAQQPPQNQLHQQGQFLQQQPVPPQLRPSYPPQLQQSQNYVGMPMMPNQGIHLQSHPPPSGGFGPVAHSGPALNQNYAKSTVLEQNVTAQETIPPSKALVEKDFEGKSLKEEVVTEKNGTVVKDTSNAAEDGFTKSVIKQEQDDVQGSLEHASGEKSLKPGLAEGEFFKEEGRLLADSDSLKQSELDNQKMKLSKAVIMGPSSANFDNQSHTVVSAPNTEGQQRPQAQVQGQLPSIPAPQGPRVLPHPGQSLNPAEGRTPGYFGSQPKSFESQSAPQGQALASLPDPRGLMGRAPPLRLEGEFGSQHAVRPNEVAMSKDQMLGSNEGGPLMKNYGNDPSFLKMNGATAPDSSLFGSRDEKLNSFSREHLNSFPREPFRPHDQASRPIYDAGSKFDPGALGPHSRFLPPHHPSGGHGHADAFGPGSEFGRHHVKQFVPRSPDREYHGSPPGGFGGPSSFPRGVSGFNDVNASEAHRFGEGSRSFNVSSDPDGNPFRDGRFPPLPGHLRRGEIDGPRNPRFGEHMAPGLLRNHRGSDDVFGQDEPGHLMRGKFPGPGNLPNHFNMAEGAGPGAFHGRAGELGGPGNFPRLPFSEPAGGDRSSFPHFGDPRMRDSYPPPFAGGMDSLDQTRKRNPVSMGWCRICKLDCETVEGLDMHSQTREHQNMAMDMVRTIKLQNKKQRTSAGHMVHEGGSRGRKAGFVGRGS
ncbi:hypothetical protein BUALT_Bualt15G0092700 [Buddleja alternifolia]|uniref:RING-type domain-containing protein n=1 Tax=Buddleja alternifolia TaxID=168488 RepID=A0AAV6WLK8_9LAMI|nr:hypothetical protein BUALT_Bualt15G0092700 [Buddleja alternifolia]